MENKYYVPSIEEFHVGFEFEFSGTDCYWNRTSFEKRIVLPSKDEYFDLFTLGWVQQIYYNLNDSLENWIRVKYLDREDIENLGWGNYKKSIWDFYEIEKQFRLSSGHWGSKFILSHDRTNEFTTITDDDICHNILIKADIGGNIDTLFEGTVKNKSELKKLMKQLGIWKD